MTQPGYAPAAAIGACLNCRQLFLITPDTPNCYLCGRAPAFTLPFAVAAPSAHPEPVEGPAPPPPAAPPTLIGVTCPHCHSDIRLSITDSEISVVQPPAPEPAEEEPEPGLTPPLTSEPAEEGSALPRSEYPDQVAGLEPLPTGQDRTTASSP